MSDVKQEEPAAPTIKAEAAHELPIISNIPTTGAPTNHPFVKTETETEFRSSTEPQHYNTATCDDDGFAESGQIEDNENSDDNANKTCHLQQLIEGAHSPELLELAVSVGARILQSLRVHLSADAESKDCAGWIDAVNELESRAQPIHTVVGVVGNTGAGKSSVINALLDEERLLPTNCMRACTASPTELSYNYSSNPNHLYRAEVEFITQDEWENELDCLYNDLINSVGEVSRDSKNPESEAGIAYAKVKAVYPMLTKEAMASLTPKELAADSKIAKVMGKTKKIAEKYPGMLYRQLQHYVDSKEKATGDKSKKGAPDMEYWPLIKVVRIFTKADALSTGAVIVDLPGVQDSNAARAAVAANYMKSCTGLWIVAPINRAVDDKTAKSLLGDSFRRQLKFDGTYSAVTFICSKTDDISITEAAESLDIEEAISASWKHVEDMRASKDNINTCLRDLKTLKDDFYDKIEDLDIQYEHWEELGASIKRGEAPNHPGGQGGKKRKREATVGGSRKRQTRSRSTFSDPESGSSDSSDEIDSYSEKENAAVDDVLPLTIEQVDGKLQAIKDEKKLTKKGRKENNDAIVEARAEIHDLDKKIHEVEDQMKLKCIQRRNEYSRSAIGVDFAAGIKELDQENAMDADEDNFDPEKQLRDYDEVARSLPVFCVSSRAYQKIRGRLQKDSVRNEGFSTARDTEVPQLQEHAKRLTEAGRISTCRGFLNDLRRHLTSMILWSSSDRPGLGMSDKEQQTEQRRLEQALVALDEELTRLVDNTLVQVDKILVDNIYNAFNAASPVATEAAVPTCSGWGAHRSMGGMHFSTYKATVRRGGIFSGASGPRDFNQDLFDPILKGIQNGWERTFQRSIPRVFDKLSVENKVALESFHQTALAGARRPGFVLPGIGILKQQIEAHKINAGNIQLALSEEVQTHQKEINRSFTPTIMKCMRDAYETCTAERGPGSYMRMKQAMTEHVDSNKHTMFGEVLGNMMEQMQDMVGGVKKTLLARKEEVYSQIARDYLAVIVGNTKSIQTMKPTQRLVRREIKTFLENSDNRFDDLESTRLPPSDEEAGGRQSAEDDSNDEAEVGGEEVLGEEEEVLGKDGEDEELQENSMVDAQSTSLSQDIGGNIPDKV